MISSTGVAHVIEHPLPTGFTGGLEVQHCKVRHERHPLGQPGLSILQGHYTDPDHHRHHGAQLPSHARGRTHPMHLLWTANCQLTHLVFVTIAQANLCLKDKGYNHHLRQ